MTTLYIAIELSSKTWKLGFARDAKSKTKIIDVPARDWDGFEEAVSHAKTHFGLETPRILSVYEAGRDGFWIHRGLLKRGIVNNVIDSSSIEVNRRKRHAKTDNIDVRAMIRLLIRYDAGDEHAFRIVQVPSNKDEDERHLHRELESAKKGRTSINNRVKSLLIAQGIPIVTVAGLATNLDKLCDGNGEPITPCLKERLRVNCKHFDLLNNQIREQEAEQEKQARLAATDKTAQVQTLTALKGIGVRSSWILVMEVFGWRTFQNRKQAGAFPGLVPVPWSSGTLSRDQGISKAGNARIRWLMVELAWLWIRWQPDSKLSKWFLERAEGRGKRIRRVTIVAVARKLFIDLWRYLTLGVVPEGAIMSPN